MTLITGFFIFFFSPGKQTLIGRLQQDYCPHVSAVATFDFSQIRKLIIPLVELSFKLIFSLQSASPEYGLLCILYGLLCWVTV